MGAQVWGAQRAPERPYRDARPPLGACGACQARERHVVLMLRRAGSPRRIRSQPAQGRGDLRGHLRTASALPAALADIAVAAAAVTAAGAGAAACGDASQSRADGFGRGGHALLLEQLDEHVEALTLQAVQRIERSDAVIPAHLVGRLQTLRQQLLRGVGEAWLRGRDRALALRHLRARLPHIWLRVTNLT